MSRPCLAKGFRWRAHAVIPPRLLLGLLAVVPWSSLVACQPQQSQASLGPGPPTSAAAHDSTQDPLLHPPPSGSTPHASPPLPSTTGSTRGIGTTDSRPPIVPGANGATSTSPISPSSADKQSQQTMSISVSVATSTLPVSSHSQATAESTPSSQPSLTSRLPVHFSSDASFLTTQTARKRTSRAAMTMPSVTPSTSSLRAPLAQAPSSPPTLSVSFTTTADRTKSASAQRQAASFTVPTSPTPQLPASPNPATHRTSGSVGLVQASPTYQLSSMVTTGTGAKAMLASLTMPTMLPHLATTRDLRSQDTASSPRTTLSSATDTPSTDETALLALLAVVSGVTGIVVLLMLVYLIYRQNVRFKRARAANRRPLGAVNQMFFSADVLLEESGPHSMAGSSVLTGNESGNVDSGLGAQRSGEADATSEYSSSSESLEHLHIPEQPEPTAASGGRGRTMTEDSGCEQGNKDDFWESGVPHVHIHPTMPIATQHVYTNINSESDLDLDVDKAETKPKPCQFPQLPATSASKEVQARQLSQTSSGSPHLSSGQGAFDCQPVVNAVGMVVRTARFPSKTSSQLSGSSPSATSADHLTS